ncbi:MAG: ferrochelatase [Parachlamydia sp.]|jgi:ferrochelatase|nr:ferrochelatase [Parachlamydia sp.]
MTQQKKTGILLVNLGTPKTPHPKDVYRYLIEFLTDERVINCSWLKRQLLVRGIIVPFRFRQSARLYQKIWTDKGSPLLMHGLDVRDKLQNLLDDNFQVELAMRYQNPSISEALEKLKNANHIVIFPFFPQYASATTGSVHQKIMDSMKQWTVIPRLTFINSYPDHPGFIEAFCTRARQYDLSSYSHILFSFHGLPQQQLRVAYPDCQKKECCLKCPSERAFCYKAQCYQTAQAISNKLSLQPDQFTICFQSRLGKEPWIQPYTSDILKTCAARGDKRLLVFCPSFVCDCLETICEISYEYEKEFKAMGGECLHLVEGLNSHPDWIQAIKDIISKESYEWVKNSPINLSSPI